MSAAEIDTIARTDYCHTCEKRIKSESAHVHESHANGRKHVKKLMDLAVDIVEAGKCTLCGVRVTASAVLHIQGKAHQANLVTQREDDTDQEQALLTAFRDCTAERQALILQLARELSEDDD